MKELKELDDKDKDRIYAAGRIDDKRTARFPEVTGLCRTCKHAWITRRQYEAIPDVTCQQNYEHWRRVHLDISECSEYARRGEMSLGSMMDIAHILDTAQPGGQYL